MHNSSLNNPAQFGALAPNYTAGISMALNVEHTAGTAGWVLWRTDNITQGNLTVNGVFLGIGVGAVNHFADSNSMLVPVKKGDVYKAAGSTILLFYPME